MKNLILKFCAFLVLFSSTACKNDKTLPFFSQKEKIYKIGLSLSYGGLGDQSFNDIQYKGLVDFSNNHKNIEIFSRSPITNDEYGIKRTLRELARIDGCDLIFVSGFMASTPIDEIATLYPDKKFILLDQFAKPRENVSSVIYAQHEGSFVVGALASYMTKTKQIGIIGGVDITVIKSFIEGYIEGARYADPSVNVITRFCSIAPDYSGFNVPDKGYKIAKEMYGSNIDIIYAVAGGSGNGIIKAARDTNHYVIGVDSDQDHLAKGFVLTSMMKRLDISINDLCEKFIKGELEGNKTYEYSYKNKGVGITDMVYTKDKIPAEIMEKIKIIEAKVANGEIHITNLMKSQ